MKYKATPQARHITSAPDKNYKKHTRKHTSSNGIIPYSQTRKRKAKSKIEKAYKGWKEKKRNQSS